jgi:hypothetical protein
MAKWYVQSRGYPQAGANLNQAHASGASDKLPIVCRDGNNQRSRDFYHTPFPLSVTANPLAEGACHVERLLSLKHVVAGPSQLIGDGLLGNQNVAFSQLTLVVTFNLGTPDMLDEATHIVDFFRKQDEVKRMKKNIKRRIVESSFDDPEVRTAVMDRFMELARVKFKG